MNWYRKAANACIFTQNNWLRRTTLVVILPIELVLAWVNVVRSFHFMWVNPPPKMVPTAPPDPVHDVQDQAG